MASTPSKGQRFDVFPVLLGLLALAFLIPAAALYVHSGMSPWGEAHASPPSSEGDGPPGQNIGKGETDGDGDRGSPPDHSKGQGHQHSTTTSSSTTSSSTTTSAPVSTTTISTTTSSPSTTSTTISSDPGVVDDVISGDACPCTVTGNVQLQGQINLRGDLMVHGGTLVAKPGVELNGNGFQIMFMDGGRADFQGTPVFTWSDNGSRQNLARDINFRNLRRIMFHSGAGASVLRYFTVSDSGTSALGDYPLHWHLNGNSTRGTIVEGVVVVNGRHHAFVPHGSHGITFKDTIAKKISGDAYWWDAPGTNESCSFTKFCTRDNSNDIVYDRALVDGLTNGPGDDRAFRLAGFVLGAGSGNVIRNSAAINIDPSHVKDCSGFHWPEEANQNEGGNVWVFQNNYSFSGKSGPSGSGGPDACHGIFIWQNDGNHHVINGFTGGGIDHGAYKNRYEYRNVQVPYVEVHARGVAFIGGNVGEVTAEKHQAAGSADNPTAVFTNTAIDRFVLRNGKGQPGFFVFNNTGLTCSDIVEQSVATGTVVVIDGHTC